MHLLEKRLDDFLVRALVVFNVLIQLLANGVVFGVHALLGFPSRVRVHPVLNDTGLVARCQVNELNNVLMCVIIDPLVVLHVHGFALQVLAMNGSLVHVNALQIINNDGNDLSYYRHSDGSKQFRLLVCSGCVRPQVKQTVFRTRDANSAINIMNLTKCWIEKQERPACFQISSFTTSNNQNEVEKLDHRRCNSYY